MQIFFSLQQTYIEQKGNWQMIFFSINKSIKSFNQHSMIQ